MIKHKLLPLLLAVITAAVVLTACGGGDKATADEAVNRVYPEGEGRYFEETAAELTTEAPGTVAAGTTGVPTATKAPSVKKNATTTSGTTPTAVNPAVTSPSATIAQNVPADNVDGGNINPNIADIQNAMMEQINALAVQSISLSASSLTLETGESRTLDITFNPSNAANKSVTVTVGNNNVTATVSGSTVTVTGSKAGACTLTVTSNNGHTATCDITVKRAPTEVTDDTPLSHNDLVTVTNAERWTAAVTAHLKSIGMTQDGSLQGENVPMSTENLNNLSYNDAEDYFITEAEYEAGTLTGGDWGSYKFNCFLRTLGSGEYAIIIAITQI